MGPMLTPNFDEGRGPGPHASPPRMRWVHLSPSTPNNPLASFTVLGGHFCFSFFVAPPVEFTIVCPQSGSPAQRLGNLERGHCSWVAVVLGRVLYLLVGQKCEFFTVSLCVFAFQPTWECDCEAPFCPLSLEEPLLDHERLQASVREAQAKYDELFAASALADDALDEEHPLELQDQFSVHLLGGAWQQQRTGRDVYGLRVSPACFKGLAQLLRHPLNRTFMESFAANIERLTRNDMVTMIQGLLHLVPTASNEQLHTSLEIIRSVCERMAVAVSIARSASFEYNKYGEETAAALVEVFKLKMTHLGANQLVSL